LAQVSRNELCPCGSGLKFKRCCIDSTRPPRRRIVLGVALGAAAVAAGVVAGVYLGLNTGLGVTAGALLFAGIVLVVSQPPPSSGKRRNSSNIDFGR
jgi:hypothetical protein